MKTVVILLIAYLSFLTVQPVMAGTMMHAKHDCCSKDHAGQSSKHNEANSCCPKGVCSPFQSCGCLIGFKVDRQEFKLVNVTEAKVQIPVKNDDLLSSFYVDCFRPPEII